MRYNNYSTWPNRKPTAEKINVPDNRGNTYLHLLCDSRAPINLIEEAITSLGADIQLLNKEGLPPLAFALKEGRLDVVELLIKAGAEIYLKSPKGDHFNAVIDAVHSGRRDILEFILKCGGAEHVNKPGIGMPSLKDLSAVSIAVTYAYVDLLEPLFNAGAFLSKEEGKDKLTPLQRSTALASGQVTEKLIKLGAWIEQPQSETGMTALHYAASRNQFIVARSLLEAGADPDVKTNEGLTALMIAADIGSRNIVRILIENGANVNESSGKNLHKTALHIAAARGDDEIIHLLLKAEADPLLTDKFNQTAKQYARKHLNRSAAHDLEEAEIRAESAIFDKKQKKFGP